MSQQLVKACATVHVQNCDSIQCVISEPVVLRLTCSCGASDQWDTTGEDS